MDVILSKEYYRRTFFVMVILIVLLTLITRFFILPIFASEQSQTWTVFLGVFLDNLVISMIVAVFLGCFVFWLTPDIVKRSQIEVIPPKQINPLLKAATISTKSWIFKGACGRYTRATTIPKLADAARVEGLGRDITICILNPKNEELCNSYAIYRRSLKSSNSGEQWNKQLVQEEILATAVTALKYQFSAPQLRIRVFFVEHFSAFRLDIADQYVIVTKEDKEASALRADVNTYFYDSYKDDVRLTERQSQEMASSKNLEFIGDVDEHKLREVIRVTGIFEEDKLNDLNLSRLLNSINAPKDPY
ncbi:hypothetical protein [Methylophilus sp.]|uniref:hypothetical protein n=1 Tax=Methylophilus sp. TaxID=29541 RepID=UPI004037376C